MPGRILIVEDERITAEDLRDILTDFGYDVVGVVSSGVEAIRSAEDLRPDLALMDIRIKGDMDGTEVARALRTRLNIPVVYLTAHADSETLERARHAEPLGYITKPFQEAELHASIEMALHKHREDLKTRDREQLLASTLGAIEQAIISVDREGNVKLLNRTAQASTGWTSQDATGKPLRDVLTLIDAATGNRVNPLFDSVLDHGAVEELSSGLLLLRGTGDKQPVSGSIAPIRDHHDHIAGAVIVFETGRGDLAPPPRSGLRKAANEDDDGIGLGDFKMIAASPRMKQVLRFSRRVAESEASTILLEGESGTGKDVVAQFMHHVGNRRNGPFVSINCAAIPETLLESELFGYDKGAFTDARAPKAGILEIASGGTIFLDEIGEMPVVIQAKLLRVLEEQTFRRLGGVRDIHVDLRVMAATNRKLVEAIDEGKFRLDLYYRLNVIQVCLPPLRERPDDILPLARHFIGLYNTRFRRNILGLSHAAEQSLLAYDWPGNVRELRNMMERAMVLEDSDWVQPSSLQLNGGGRTPPLESAPARDITLEEAERRLLVNALEKADGNQTRAAVLLGISRDALRYKMKKFNLSRRGDTPSEHSEVSA